MSLLNKEKLYHDLAILEYTDSFREAGYEVTIPGSKNEGYVPDMILVKDQKKTYIEFKVSNTDLNETYFLFKDTTLRNEPDSEFLLIIVNETYKPKLNVQLPKINKIIDTVFRDKIEKRLKTDINSTGKYSIFQTAIRDLVLDKISIIRGTGVIRYSVAFNEENRTVIDNAIELNFKYEFQFEGYEIFKNEVENIKSKKIIIDKAR